jgi:hypothetical protein
MRVCTVWHNRRLLHQSYGKVERPRKNRLTESRGRAIWLDRNLMLVRSYQILSSCPLRP